MTWAYASQFIETGDRSEYGIERQRLRFSVLINKKYRLVE